MIAANQSSMRTLADSSNLPGVLRRVCVSVPLPEFNAVSAFNMISADGRGFILDGVSPESGAGRFVYVGAGDCETLFTGPGTTAGDVNPALTLRERLDGLRLNAEDAHRHDSAKFRSGAIGFFGYEAIRHFEPSVGDLPADPIELPEAAFFLPREFVVYDRLERVLTAVVLIHADGDDETAASAAVRAQSTLELIGSASDSAEITVASACTPVGHDPEMKQRYEDMVRRARVEIERGELIQIVLSQRTIRRTEATPIEVYTALSALNPSPYMFMLNFGKFAIVGCSPELMVRSSGDRVSMHPIAGTRPRGATAEMDLALESELLASEKERAEHVMLVDLARNDLGRVSEPGSVKVDSFMDTERYSHVMHLVSSVSGRLRSDRSGLDAFVAGFPLGTLTGAPRLRSISLIKELEGTGRGAYCGGVGWFDASGDLDTGTTIRCIVMKDGVAHVQGGGGIVFDSDPEREYFEASHKMTAQLAAIDFAERVSDAIPERTGRGVTAG